MDQFNWTDDERHIFSLDQIQICELKRQGMKQEYIQSKLMVTAQAISSAICHTISGNRWIPHYETGGNTSYIGDVDTYIFKKKIEDYGLNLDCLKTIEAYEISYELRCQRFERANYIIKLVTQKSIIPPRYQRTLRQLEPYVPCDSWLTNFAKANKITLKSAETLEEARRRFCTSSVISSFFRKHSLLLKSVHPENNWNADESSSVSTKRYKILLTDNHSYAVSSMNKHEMHVTGMYCFNAIGEKIDPFIILPNIENLPIELQNLKAFFCSQRSGWMTSKLFIVFCIYFAAKVSHYRLQLPPNLASEPTILIVDNHPSRISFFCNRISQTKQYSFINDATTFISHFATIRCGGCKKFKKHDE